jgi:predicted nucleic acid-binding protein
MSSAEPLFLDTSGLVALLVADDTLHDEASRHFQTLRRGGQPLITTDWVLAEMGNSLARPPVSSGPS